MVFLTNITGAIDEDKKAADRKANVLSSDLIKSDPEKTAPRI